MPGILHSAVHPFLSAKEPLAATATLPPRDYCTPSTSQVANDTALTFPSKLCSLSPLLALEVVFLMFYELNVEVGIHVYLVYCGMLLGTILRRKQRKWE